MTSITILFLENFDAALLFTETDTLTDEIKWKAAYEEFFKRKHLFDFSHFSEDSKFGDILNQMVIGEMKDANKGIPIN